MRVLRNTLLLARLEEAKTPGDEPVCDLRTAALAALLHDVDDRKLFHSNNNENARRFLEENRDVEREQLTEYISEYEFSYIIDEGRIRDNISAPMGLLKKKSLVRKIVDFIRSFVEKYQ